MSDQNEYAELLAHLDAFAEVGAHKEAAAAIRALQARVRELEKDAEQGFVIHTPLPVVQFVESAEDAYAASLDGIGGTKDE